MELRLACRIKGAINTILREWRDLWPGGLSKDQYSTLNLIAHCREGSLGSNLASCDKCHHQQWYASSCGDRHCPNCLGPRQMEWSEKVCRRLPDCPHFHVVFTVPEQLHEFFEGNYRIAAAELFGAAAETLKTFQKNNWHMQGGFLGVLHTWGSSLNWHPHLHMLVAAGGADLTSGCWKEARANYLFPVRAMSQVFRAIFLRRLEELDAQSGIAWPDELDTVEARRSWRLRLATRNWNIFSRATLGNTRSVVRYLARYTSRIAISNHRIIRVDSNNRSVTFSWTDYRNNARKTETTLSGQQFLRSFTRHLVPKGFRRVRYFGLLVGDKERLRSIPGSPQTSIHEDAPPTPHPPCPRCGNPNWTFHSFYQHPTPPIALSKLTQGFTSSSPQGRNRFSLDPPAMAP